MRNLKEGGRIGIFKFVKRVALPGVESGELMRTENGYLINIVKDGNKYSYAHEGNLDKNTVLQTLKQIQATLDYSKLTQQERDSVGLSAVAPKRSNRGSGKPTDKIDAVVIERSGGFTIGGLQSPSYIAGDPTDEHWVMASWNSTDYDLYDINSVDREFLRRHLAAIAYKVNPGAEPEIDYFTTPQLAINRLIMLQQKHGAPGGSARVVADATPPNTPSSGDVVKRLTLDRSVE